CPACASGHHIRRSYRLWDRTALANRRCCRVHWRSISWPSFRCKDKTMSVLDRFRLDGKRAFITGGSRGLGREMALALADVGADIVLVGREVDSLTSTASDIRKLGRKADTLVGDVGLPGDCETICQKVLEQFG